MSGSNAIDKLNMLFSADWFRSYLKLLFPNLDNRAIDAIQRSAREVVKEFMGEESVYWNITFSKERHLKSKASFIENLKSSRISESDIQRILAFYDNEGNVDEAEKITLWLCWTLSESLLRKEPEFDIPNIDRKVLEKIKQEIENAARSDILDNFEDIAITSSTHWDQYLKSLTPDLPTYLSDYASGYFGNLDQFRVFWNNVCGKFSKKQVDMLIKWYEDSSIEIAGSDFKFVLPSWMKQ